MTVVTAEHKGQQENHSHWKALATQLCSMSSIQFPGHSYH